MLTTLPKDFMQKYLVDDDSDSEDERPSDAQCQLTPRQRIAVYMCGVRPKDVKIYHSSPEQASQYVKTCMRQRDRFAMQQDNNDRICPGT